ncbi:FAD/NAD(P)-binding protein [Mesorhizobium sp. CAU 1732]|uniref:NAD(P)/FAD-dependent oxidoreductase n=1 Tax=Mesorhizobium sp. CAU 1732 TaxID=3140358 RepID=UPI0032610301
MNREDKDLGMATTITRRNFIQGVAVAAASSSMLASGGSAHASASSPATGETYPPMRTGMRGMHPGSFEAAHDLRDGATFGAPENTDELYDLVVVGGGLSGLASAHFFRKRFGNDAKILIIDNHDDFGGHAKRNEFEHEGKILMANGGSSYLVGPSYWTNEAKTVLSDLGIAKGHEADRVDRDLYKGLGMAPSTFFRGDVYGEDRLVAGGTPQNPTEEFLARTPFPDQVGQDLMRLIHGSVDYLPGMSTDEKIAKLRSISYRDYLLDVAKVHPDVVPIIGGVWCLGPDMGSAWFAFFRRRPGFDGLGLERPWGSPEAEEITSDDYSLPAGNSDVARLLVRALIPEALPEGGPTDVQTQRVDYRTLDRDGAKVRIRLSSIVVKVEPSGKDRAIFRPDDGEIGVTYINDGKLKRVRGNNVVLACMNNVIPHILPELPQPQKDALHQAVRAANQMTNVLFRNWEPFEQLKTNSVTFPSTFYGRMALTSPRYFGDLTPSTDPSQPIVVSFNTGINSGIASNPFMVEGLLGEGVPPPGTHMDDQFRMIRFGLLDAPFETFERHVREQSVAALSGTSFDPARDILAITVNRWPHGFTTGRNTLFAQDREAEESPTILARRPFGRITIANADAGGVSTAGTAIDQAFRAIRELEQSSFGFYEQI